MAIPSIPVRPLRDSGGVLFKRRSQFQYPLPEGGSDLCHNPVVSLQPDASDQFIKARVAAQGIQSRFDIQPDHRPFTLLKGFVEIFKRLFLFSQQGEEVIHVPNAKETVFQQVVIAPGGYTGWHSHPGPVLVLIKSGQLSFYDGEDPTCTPRVYTARQAFFDRGQGHVHIGRNEGSENLEMWSAYLDVPPGEAFRIDVPAPGNCGF